MTAANELVALRRRVEELEALVRPLRAAQAAGLDTRNDIFAEHPIFSHAEQWTRINPRTPQRRWM